MTELVRVIAAGIDSLYATSRQAPGFPSLEKAMELKDHAIQTGEPALWELHEAERNFLVRPHGWRRYPLWLTSPAMDVFCGASPPFPPIYAQLRSPFIHSIGVECAVVELERVVRALSPDPQDDSDQSENVGDIIARVPGDALQASRVDVYADVQGWAPCQDDFALFITRATKRRMFEINRQVHAWRGTLSGFSFGARDIVARIYNKTLELGLRGETWPQEIWHDAELAIPVWRIEFQFRRGALRSFGIDSVQEALIKRQALWEYAIHWLSHRERQDDPNRSRWPNSQAWESIASARIGSTYSSLVRERIHLANERRLLRGFMGYATSLAAIKGNEHLGFAMQQLAEDGRGYLKTKGTTFADVVRSKRERSCV